MNQEKGGNKALFYDTYALYAIVKGEENYKEYVKNYKIITNLMNNFFIFGMIQCGVNFIDLLFRPIK